MRMESLRADADEIHIVAGLPYKNTDKFSLDDSAPWVKDEDVIAR